MSIVAILSYPNPRLHKKAKLVSDVKTYSVQKMVDDMFTTLANTRDCAGLAATQLDFSSPWAITVLNDYSEDKSQPLCLINPTIVETEGEQFEEEGCMSVYPKKISAPVKRPASLLVKALDPEGNSIEYRADGFAATLIQHEVDHLDGMIYLQRVNALRRERVEKAIKKIIRSSVRDT